MISIRYFLQLLPDCQVVNEKYIFCSHNYSIWLVYGFIFAEYVWKNKLRFVRIFFGTPTFDRIVKDRAAKFEDMLAAIGGTMGLLTGFSIISGVEIIYFAGKILFNILNSRKIKI